MEAQTAPTGVYNNAYNITELDTAQTLLGLSNMTNLPTIHGRHEELQMLDGALHADTRGKHNKDSNAERLHSPLLKADYEDKQKKRKRGDKAATPESVQCPNGFIKNIRCTEASRRDDRHRQGRIIVKIKVGNKILGTKADPTRSPIAEQLSGAREKCGLLKPSARISFPRGQSSDDDPTVPVADSVTKQSFTTHTRFSFSILRLLSAVRMALIVQFADDYKVADEHTEEGSRRHIMNTEQMKRNGLPSLTIYEIVQRVRRRPEDPKILEAEEPLQDLVKGVLNIFSSQTALSGVKSWKGLASYDTSTKSWYWTGPVPSKLKSRAWGISPETLPELIDCFAEWMRQRQETLELIRSLPPPPVLLMQQIDMEERFRHHKSLKSPNTISPSTEEVKAHFHLEEALRYQIPDRAFPYTARDGTKCTVAPLRRCITKPSARARDHYLLRKTRPDHFSILCLVRDAAARLPGSIGTRTDVCTLARDSQYIMENIPGVQIQQAVSGALDRLHSEIDPCVRFDREKHLWVYLHGDRTDVDFKNHGPRPRNKSKRSED